MSEQKEVTTFEQAMDEMCAHSYQGSWDASRILREGIVLSYKKALARIAELGAERDQWKTDAVNGGNAAFLRQQLAATQLQARTLRDALVRIETAIDWHLGRSAFTQSKNGRGFGFGEKIRAEVYGAHDAVRGTLSAPLDTSAIDALEKEVMALSMQVSPEMVDHYQAMQEQLTDWERRSQSCESKLGQLEANEQLTAALDVLKTAKAALEYHVEQTRPIERTTLALAKINELLEGSEHGPSE